MIATTILQQLGGNKFLAMTGAKQLTDLGNGLRMKLTRNKAGAQYLFITLNSLDLYDIKFSSFDKQLNEKVKAKFTDIYCDQLQGIFTEVTGLYTKLF